MPQAAGAPSCRDERAVVVYDCIGIKVFIEPTQCVSIQGLFNSLASGVIEEVAISSLAAGDLAVCEQEIDAIGTDRALLEPRRSMMAGEIGGHQAVSPDFSASWRSTSALDIETHEPLARTIPQLPAELRRRHLGTSIVANACRAS